MNSIVKYSCAELAGAEISCVMVDGEPWFKAKDVTDILKHSNTTKALKDHVYDDDKRKYNQLVSHAPSEPVVRLDASVSNVSFVNESGLYALIFGSKLDEAKIFKRWVTNEVLRSIRKTGKYALPTVEEPVLLHKQIKLINENDLHFKVIDLIRTKFPDLVVIPGLGELQRTPQMRHEAYKKGYSGGQPDITIVTPNKQYNGFAIELKTPKGTGSISDKQIEYLASLKDCKYKTLVSCDYDEIVIELTNYCNELRHSCSCCSKVFRTKRTLEGHFKTFHSHSH